MRRLAPAYSDRVDPRRTVLYPEHVAAGAKLADFGGWDMPIEYPTGVVAEHTAVRTEVGVFDVSHMGRLRVRGPQACAALNSVLCNDLGRIGPGRAQYSMLLNAAGGVVDDLIVYVIAADDVLVVPNAGNAAVVLAALRVGLPRVDVRDHQDDSGIIAVQGPRSRALLAALGLPVGSLEYMAFMQGSWGGESLLVCRSGYTGELGFELMAPRHVLRELWEALVREATPCGLGARDTLRTEMGYPLHGQDLSPTITALEAGLSWAVGWAKSQFVGREALLDQRAAGRSRALRGLVLTGRGVPRPHMDVSRPGGAVVGHTTSGTFSPTLRQGIALALLDPGVALDEEVLVDIRGRAVPARLVRTPFVDRSPR
jgi:aminomethyltransferase